MQCNNHPSIYPTELYIQQWPDRKSVSKHGHGERVWDLGIFRLARTTLPCGGLPFLSWTHFERENFFVIESMCRVRSSSKVDLFRSWNFPRSIVGQCRGSNRLPCVFKGGSNFGRACLRASGRRELLFIRIFSTCFSFGWGRRGV
jgi:hypothetical protein